MKPDLYVRNGRIVLENGAFDGGVVVNQGKVADLVSGNPEIAADEVLDLNGKTLLPGLVDMHVHFHAPGRDHWEGYITGSMAAAAGGVTTVVDMPLNGIPPTTNRDKLLEKRRLIQKDPIVDYAHWAGLVNNNLDAMDGLCQEGVVGYKAFMSGAATDEFKRVDDDVLYAGLLKAGELGLVVAAHAENEYLISYLEKKLQGEGRKDLLAWTESRPPAVELEAIQRALFWAKETQSTLHIVHISVAEGIKAVARAKVEGVRATAETCPHFLFFDQGDYARIGVEAKSDPPVRPAEEVNALWECVLNGRVDNIASDHAPSTAADKEQGKEDIFKAWAGITGIQAMLPAVLTRGVHQRGLQLPDLVRMMSANPARICGIYPQKGSLLPGSDADMTIVDLAREWTLTTDQLFSKNKHSPYVGSKFKGSVEGTFVRGKLVFYNGQVLASPGYGQLVRRTNYHHETIQRIFPAS